MIYTLFFSRLHAMAPDVEADYGRRQADPVAHARADASARTTADASPRTTADPVATEVA